MFRFASLPLALAFFLASSGNVALAQEPAASGRLEQGNTSTPKEKREFAQKSVSEMSDSVRSVSKLLEAAERAKETSKIQCLSKKMAGLRALYEVSQAAEEALESALRAGDNDRAEHEFRKITVALTKVRQFVAEAEACVGENDTAPGVVNLDVEIEGGEAALEASTDGGGGYDIDLGVDPPGSSPFE